MEARKHSSNGSFETGEEIWKPDFEIKSCGNSSWRVVIKTKRGSDWIRKRTSADLFGNAGSVTTTDVTSINNLLGTARNQGFRVEYIGPNQVVRF